MAGAKIENRGHLYRHHRIFPCQRCKQLFKNQDEVNKHLRESTPCKLSDDDHPDGVTADIVEKLRSKKTAQRKEVERWQDIYKLLFPNEMVPSPCKTRLLPLPSSLSFCWEQTPLMPDTNA